ncbi:MAG TPA: VCBS repeat-containing protein [Verrucomicrobiae bacterium]|jgi:hypothetical protein
MRYVPRLAAALGLFLTIDLASSGFAQGTAFTYQGRLNSGGSLASGGYDMLFTLYAINAGGVAIAGPVTNTAIAVSNGLFTTMIDFGPNVFTGASNWLEIAVQTNNGSGFTTLSPRQQLTSVPYAIFANMASNLSGTVSAGQISGTIPLNQLPAAVVTNNSASVNLTGSFAGNAGGLTNLQLSAVGPAGTFNLLADYFAPPFTLTGFNWPYSIAVADVNGDGIPDLIVSTYPEDGSLATLTVLTNNGNGVFSSNATLTLPGGINTEADCVVAADINGDGKPDLIAVDSAYDSLTVFTNNGSGGFGLNATLTVGNGPTCVVAVDLNGNGKSDLVALNAKVGSLTVLTNNGSGVLHSSAALNAGGDVWVTTADINGDGKPDLICANYTGGTLQIFTNNGQDVFSYKSPYLYESEPGSGADYVVAVTNLDGHGLMALITANYVADTLTVETNDGFGNFALSATLNVGNGPDSIAVADVNGDGKPDLICANHIDETLTVLTNNGSGGFGFNATIPAGAFPGSLVTADINGDGKPDFIFANRDDRNNSNFDNNKTVTVLMSSSQVVAATNAESFTDYANDFDGHFSGWFNGSFTGNGYGLTGLNAANITSGTVSLANLPGSLVTDNETGVTLGGTFNGNGSGLSNVVNSASLGGTSGTVFNEVQAGQAQMPSSTLNETNFLITFPHAFSSAPKITATIAFGTQGVVDMYALCVSSNSTTAFRVSVMRLDSSGGWGQNLLINWVAWQ